MIGSLDHVAEVVSRQIDTPLSAGTIELKRLTAEQAVTKLVFVIVTRDRDQGQYSYLMDIAHLTTYIGVERHRTGCFVFNKGVWDLLNEGVYKYWFAVVNGELVRVKKAPVDTLFNAINIKLTRSNDSFLSREIDYPYVGVKQPYLPQRGKDHKRLLNPKWEHVAAPVKPKKELTT